MSTENSELNHRVEIPKKKKEKLSVDGASP